MKQRFHPEGVASLVAAILVTGDVSVLPEKEQRQAAERVIDFRRTQVLELAREYYKVYPCDFDVENDYDVEGGPRNSRNNLAKLNRGNLMMSIGHM